MAPRQATVVRMVEEAISLIEKDRCAFALKKLLSLDSKLTRSNSSRPKKANKYAEFVKKQFPHFKKQYPDLNATELMPLIAKKWKAEKESH